MQPSIINPALSNFLQLPNEAQIRLQAFNHKAKTSKRNFKDNSASNQCLKLLDWLSEKSSITTKQAQTDLDIMSPAARILELRKAGYQIVTVWDCWTSEYGIKHRIARYVITQKEPVVPDNNNKVADDMAIAI